MPNYLKTSFLSATLVSCIGFTKGIATKWGTDTGKEYTANCGVERELWTCPTTPEKTECVKQIKSWRDQDGIEVYQTFDTSGELINTSDKVYTEQIETKYLPSGKSMCIFFWVGDRTCSRYPSLDYDKSFSAAQTHEFDTANGSCWDTYPNCNDKYRKTFECHLKGENCEQAYHKKNPGWIKPNVNNAGCGWQDHVDQSRFKKVR